MRKAILLFSFFLIFIIHTKAQAVKDLKKSVPAWFENNGQNQVIKWIADPAATKYDVQKVTYDPFLQAQTIATVTNGMDSFVVEDFEEGKIYDYKFQKYQGTTAVDGVGFLNFGTKIPATHHRGRCYLLVDIALSIPLTSEIERLTNDLEMDGWEVTTFVVSRDLVPVEVKWYIEQWYNADYDDSQAVFILGRVAVPYAGNNAIDGHQDHVGAWSADSYYADMTGNWTDFTVNNTSASRAENKNIPNDGKFDQSTIPGTSVLEIGRVDFFNLPAFTDSEIELTRKYLDKNHAFRTGQKKLNRRGIIENNFGSFDEGFGQNGWRNLVPMFGGANVKSGNYDVELETDDYLFSFACGGGSYTSCSGIGNTSNLWASKDLKSIFTMNFGSYFGDWDSQNNFLRSALASGDILVNMWAGRPNWYLHPMALGKHVGASVPLTQNANNFYSTGFGARQTHIALMGDPTLRLHAMIPPSDLIVKGFNGAIQLDWEASSDAEEGYYVYRKTTNSDWEILEEKYSDTTYTDYCLDINVEYTYMVKAIKLEESGSGSYYNTSQGIFGSGETSVSNKAISEFTVNSNFEWTNFDNTSSNATSYLWEFGDGNTSNEESPQHIYGDGGSFNVCLTAINNFCGEDTKCQNINVVFSIPSTVDAVINEPTCHGEMDGSIEVSYADGSVDLDATWSNGVNGLTQVDLGEGEYTLTLTNQLTLNKKDFVFNLDQPNQLMVDIETTPSSGSDGTANITINGGTPPYTTNWENLDLNMLAPGIYPLEVIDANGCILSFNVTIDMFSSTINTIGNKIIITPNPTTDFLSISFKDDAFKSLKILSTIGKIVNSRILHLEENKAKVDVSALMPGVYYILIENETDQLYISRFVKI